MKNKRIRSKSILALLTLALAVGFVGLNNKTNFKVDAAPIEVTTGYQEEEISSCPSLIFLKLNLHYVSGKRETIIGWIYIPIKNRVRLL